MSRTPRKRNGADKLGDGNTTSGTEFDEGSDDGIIEPGGDGTSGIEPATIIGPGGSGGSSGDTDQPRRRKPRSDAGKSRGGKTRQTSSLGVASLKEMLLMAHVGLSMVFKNPDLELADSEGERLANAVRPVLELYDIPEVSPAVQAWLGLIMCCGAIYGPRISAAVMDRKMQAEKAASSETNNVVEMTAVGVG